jgi:hypothetical protein
MPSSELLLRHIEKHLSPEQVKDVYFRVPLSQETRQGIRLFLDRHGLLRLQKVGNEVRIWSYMLYVLIAGIVLMLAAKSMHVSIAARFGAIAIVGVIGYLFYRMKAMAKGELTEDAIFKESEADDKDSIKKPRKGAIAELRRKIGYQGYNMAMCAIQSWDLDTLKSEVEINNVSVESVDEKGYSLIAYALHANFIDGLAYLMARNVQFHFDIKDSEASLIRHIKSEEALGLLLAELDQRSEVNSASTRSHGEAA